jgi:hypothetical protein
VSAYSELVESRLLAVLERIAVALERSATVSEEHYRHVLEQAATRRRLEEAAAEGWERTNARPEQPPIPVFNMSRLVIELFEEYDRRRAGE